MIFGWIDIRQKDRIFLLSVWMLTIFSFKTINFLQKEKPKTITATETQEIYVSLSLKQTIKKEQQKEKPNSKDAPSHLWRPHNSDRINHLVIILQQRKTPSQRLIIEAYLDLDIEAFRRYKNQTTQSSNDHKQTIKNWRKKQTHTIKPPSRLETHHRILAAVPSTPG